MIPGRTCPCAPTPLRASSIIAAASSSTDAVRTQSGWVGPDVRAGAHHDVDAGRARDAAERPGVAADPVEGHVDQRPTAGVAEAGQLGDREVLARQPHVVGVARPVLADPAEVGQRQRLVELLAADHVGRHVQPAEQVLVREDHAELAHRHRPEHGHDRRAGVDRRVEARGERIRVDAGGHRPCRYPFAGAIGRPS